MSEHALQNTIRNALAGMCLLFRANVGKGWTGDAVRMPNGRDVLIRDARPFDTGLPPGFSDTFGLVPVTITQDMVGQTIGVFVAGEVKTPNGRVTPQQQAFLDAIARNGGRAAVWRSVDDAMDTIKGINGHECGRIHKTT
jgi:hypothetical protein